MPRCDWATDATPLMTRYHDYEWGVPSKDEQYTFEMLTLELMQAGLSWQTILNKRANFQVAFNHFDVDKVAAYTQTDVMRLRNDTGIVRNRIKIAATINNARILQTWHQQGQTLNAWLWHYVDGHPVIHHYATAADLPAQTPLSAQISHDMKKAGFRFVGPTIIQSFLQAIGILDDHLVTCTINHCHA
ncbi:DNA-3-methyladenine glycosylase I [Lacticaseibacillus thailandensis]|uniref:DNA-3-methyladenine glycosylase I n=1 Tax=Lacticaseibacillus thailandensis DSM 22698 = JCM 13996 TaxID=1423810 RepID=A0A0R2C831_9LACO|nr:DNA-3-methyladenine glycosylase I [Lacticaseibacillus thailandensis]KRM87902.1 DNA-3-methyladenine glycosylase I [Lacticaseibacillus thailandensis DSM 22698 = JCM 13996]